MGISSDGQLTFGVVMHDDEDGIEMPKKLREVLVNLDGDIDLDALITQELNIGKWSVDMTEEESIAYFSSLRAARKQYPVALEIFCSYDCPAYIVRPNVPGAHHHVSRGYAKELTLTGLDEGLTIESLQKFYLWCKKWGIKGEAKWLLTSLYG